MVFSRVERVEACRLGGETIVSREVREGLRAGEILTQSAENRR